MVRLEWTLEHVEFQTSLGYIIKLCLKNNAYWLCYWSCKGFVSSIYMAVHNQPVTLVPGDPTPSPDLWSLGMQVVQTHADKRAIHENKKGFSVQVTIENFVKSVLECLC